MLGTSAPALTAMHVCVLFFLVAPPCLPLATATESTRADIRDGLDSNQQRFGLDGQWFRLHLSFTRDNFFSMSFLLASTISAPWSRARG